MSRSPHSAAGTVDVIVIGAGHSGLSMSRQLSDMSVEHVVLERGEVANSWRKERWDSLRLLTPNWMSRLPGEAYAGSDPDGYMTSLEVAEFVSSYANKNRAPVQTGTTVVNVEAREDGYAVSTDCGEWWCRALVIASGACNKPSVPGCATAVPPSISQLTAMEYKNTDRLPDGGALVVGASATGLQLADEIQRSGRPVTLAVGEHVRMPRRYRGRDVQWWMLASGLLDECIEDVDDPVRVRGLPSPQLVGASDHRTLDLNALSAQGVRLVGRLAGVRDGRAMFSGSLRNVCALADLKMRRMLRAFDDWADSSQSQTAFGPASAIEETKIDSAVPLGIDLSSGEIGCIVWATGYRPDYSWLNVPVLDRKGQLQHDGGVVSAPGMYALGLPFLRRRKSSFIHGAEDDVRDVGGHLKSYLDRCTDNPTVRVAL
jgi:putative flavoprotein involved in K+ transport